MSDVSSATVKRCMATPSLTLPASHFPSQPSQSSPATVPNLRNGKFWRLRNRQILGVARFLIYEKVQMTPTVVPHGSPGRPVGQFLPREFSTPCACWHDKIYEPAWEVTERGNRASMPPALSSGHMKIITTSYSALTDAQFH